MVDCEYTATGLDFVDVDWLVCVVCISTHDAAFIWRKSNARPSERSMLEIQGAKPLTVQRNQYKGMYFKNEEFHCKIHRGDLYELTYAPKCDIETYMFTWKNQILARYIKTCVRYYTHVFPEYKSITINDKLAIHCDRSIQNAQFLFLSCFSVAFFMQPWCVRYLQAEPEENLDYTPLLKQVNKDPYYLDLLMVRSFAIDDDMSKKYNNVCASHKTLLDFFKIFTKRSRFKDCITWLPGIIRHEVDATHKRYKILALPVYQTFDSVVCTEVEYFEDIPYYKASAEEIIIRNEIIYTSGFTWADVEHTFESDHMSDSSKSTAANSSNPTTDSKTDSSEHT